MTLNKPDGKIEIGYADAHSFVPESDRTAFWRTKGHQWTRTTHTFNGLRITAIGCETVAEFVNEMEKLA